MDGFLECFGFWFFQVQVRRGDDLVLSINSKNLFDIQHLEVKKEGDDWEDPFRSHTDKRPHGPQTVSFDVSFHGSEHVYGIPERATSFALKPTKGPNINSEPYRLFNLDVFEYLDESPFGLYGSVPVMVSHSKKQTVGFFLLNAAEMQIDVLAPGWEQAGIEQVGDESSAGKRSIDEEKRVDTHWIAESGVFDAFLFVGPSPKDVVAQYCAVTGTSAIPQLFSTAYHQCRWNYKDEADVAGVDAGFDEHDIPYDTIWLDIEHTDGKKYFTWDKNLFPNPKEMQNKIGAKGRHMVTIVDPHVKRDDDFPLHKEASSHGYYVKDVNGKDFDGWCWPGASSYLDMLSPEVRSWWATKFSYSNYVGSTPILYIWNDMNEPSVFNGPEVFTFFTILAPFLLAFEQCSGRGWYFVYLDRGFFNSVVFASISTY
jgi:alpha 1,3-glucosidase